jgi:hypothetical protein
MDMIRATWRTSSYSGDNDGACVEVGATWRKSTFSGDNGGNCVEVGTPDRAVAVRDSKDPGGPQLAFGAASWIAFTRQLKADA